MVISIPPIKIIIPILLSISMLFVVQEHCSGYYLKQGENAEKARKFDLALEYYRLAYKIQSGSLDSKYAECLSDLSCRLWSKGYREKSLDIQLEAFNTYKSCLGSHHWRTLFAQSELGNMYTHENRLDEAESLLVEAFNSTSEKDEALYDVQSSRLASLYSKIGKLDEAEKLLKWLIRYAEKENDFVLASIRMNNLAAVYEDKGQLEKARALKKRAIKLNKKFFEISSAND